MTYCLGILLPTGLVLASDARSNAGVDQVARVLKLNTLTVPGDRMIAIQSAGNFIEAQPRSPFLPIGETKYGKPILYRTIGAGATLDEAAKLALLSFDATIRSNLSVGLPIDLLRYPKDSFSAENLLTVEEHNLYWRELRNTYAGGLAALVASLDDPPDGVVS